MIRQLFSYGLLALNVLVKPLKVRLLPAHIQIEVTTYCNQDCLSCGRRDIIHSPKHMKFDQFKHIYDQIHPHNINLSGLGEPLLNPDIFRMIAYSKERGSVVNFPTNLTVGERVIRKLVASGIEQIKVSVDATSGGTYMLVRQSARFDKVVRNIELVNALKKEKGLSEPEIRLNYALQSYNLKELPDLMRFADKHGVKTVYVQDLNYFSVETEKSKLCGFTREALIATLDQAESLAKDYGIETNIVNWRRNMDSFYNKTLPAKDFLPNDNHCSFPWVSVFIDVHGNVKPCPVFVWDKDAEASGNCLEQSFESIWNGETYQQLRSEFKRNERRHPICKNCVPPNLFDMRVIFQKMLIRA